MTSNLSGWLSSINGKAVEKREPSCTVGGSAHWCSDQTEWRMTQRFYFWDIPKENRSANSEEYMHPYVHCSVTYNSQDLEAAHISFVLFCSCSALQNLLLILCIQLLCVQLVLSVKSNARSRH